MNVNRFFTRILVPLLLAGISGAHAGNISIANEPLGSGASITAKPNLMFILDDSGSMASDYMPDYVTDSRCTGSNGSLQSCRAGDPLYMSSGYNTIYYNPQIRYRPPKKGDAAGTDWANASTTSPLKDPFDGSTARQNLGAYPDAAWCKSSSDQPTGQAATDTNCVYHVDGAAFNYPKYPNATYTRRIAYNAGYPYYYLLSASPSWCTNSSLTSCVARRDKTHTYPRFTGTAEIPAVSGIAASRTFYVVQSGTSSSATITVSSITYDGTTNILTGAVSVKVSNNASGRNTLANAIVAKVGNGFSATLEKDDTSGSGSSKTCSSSNLTRCPQIKITAPGGANSTANENYNNKNLVLQEPSNVNFVDASGVLAGGVNYKPAVPTSGGVTFTRVDIKSGRTYTKYPKRIDCANASCTYEEELQNFANWYSYYRTRILMTKSAMSLAFAAVSDTAPGAGLRIGLMTISAGASSTAISNAGATSCWNANKARELAIGDFNQSQKTSFYNKLFAIDTCSYTPLRAALARVGKLYAGRLTSDPVHGTDPVQYACQQNFSLLSTDGYWNSNIEDSSFGPDKMDNSDVGDQDGGSTLRPQLDGFGKSNTLADVAMYYYKNDLRPSMPNDVATSARDPNNQQHMTTFTMGLGVDGTLIYSTDYETGASPDYTAIVQNTKNWPDPIANTEDERIDDLWHAAVNGRGKYFSAADPDAVVDSIAEALRAVATVTGASAAAATSSLEPVAGDNYAYVASYTTGTWEGNLDAKLIDLNNGELSESNTWSAQAALDSKVAGVGRTIYKFDAGISGADKKELFAWDNLSATEQGYFNPAQLSQCNPLSICPGVTSQNLFDYLMGKPDVTPNRSYRRRQHVFGDIVSSQPVYVKAPPFGYLDSGYGAYKTAKANRQAMVYVGANDGFLHGFNAITGEEMWAYAPTAVLPYLHLLANTGYVHRYYVDGSVTVADIQSGGTWKTLLVGGLNAGGKSYYALDVSDPANPKALWEFSDARMGYSYGNPVISKLADGTWVVLVTSGYNNGTAFGTHDGQGVLYVLNAATGAEISRIYTCTDQNNEATCGGSAAAPSGLAKINNWVDNGNSDNTTRYVYGGDLNGDLWRFDINATPPTAIKLAALGEPISTRPELADISGKRVLLLGTGLFLQAADKSDSAARTIYGIKDCMDSSCTAYTDIKASGSGFVKQTLITSADGNSRTMETLRTVNWSTGKGWYVELLDDGERVNVDPKLQLGTLVVASNVPENSSALSCSSGGYSWLYNLDITNGGFIANSQSNPGNAAGVKLASSLVVGVNVIKLPNGKMIAIPTLSNNQRPPQEVDLSAGSSQGRRVSWRELTTD
jgi:type IV pilus assembly protein PilY1